MMGSLSDVSTRINQLERLVNPAAVPVESGGLVSGYGGTGALTADPVTSTAGFTGALSQAGAEQALAVSNAWGQSLSGALPTSGAGTSTGTSTGGADAVAVAKKYLGIPYLWGGTDPSKGLDCSGLTQLVYRQLGVSLPRVAADQARAGSPVASLSQARPGDLLFFGSPVDHVGIYLGGNKVLHAPRTGDVVRVSTVWEKPSAIRRLLPSGTGASAGVGTGALSGPYADLFTAAGRRYGVDPALLSAVAKAESGYHPEATSPAGAIGLMQLMPSTARGLGVDPAQPAQAVDGAARLLSGYLKKYHGDVDVTLAAYNAGPGAVQRYGGVPPYGETQTYVDRVTRYWEELR